MKNEEEMTSHPQGPQPTEWTKLKCPIAYYDPSKYESGSI